jgi:hypothetical protein
MNTIPPCLALVIRIIGLPLFYFQPIRIFLTIHQNRQALFWKSIHKFLTKNKYQCGEVGQPLSNRVCENGGMMLKMQNEEGGMKRSKVFGPKSKAGHSVQAWAGSGKPNNHQIPANPINSQTFWIFLFLSEAGRVRLRQGFGATGQPGSHVWKQLKRRGIKVNQTKVPAYCHQPLFIYDPGFTIYGPGGRPTGMNYGCGEFEWFGAGGVPAGRRLRQGFGAPRQTRAPGHGHE